jgi:hypothetical protein
MQELGKRFLILYSLTTFALVFALGCLVLYRGTEGFYFIQSPGHGSSLILNFLVFCISWLFIGLLILLSQFPRFAKRHAPFIIVFVVIGFAYLNAIREPHQVVYGDFRAYFLAAVDMTRGQAIQQMPDRLYLYPPLLATLLSPFVSFGLDRLVTAFHLSNYLAILLHSLLLYLVLQRYRFSRELAAVAILCILIANVPISRTLIYHQVNIHVANLILLSLLLYEKHNLLSALSLTLAVHLKVYPLLLLIPFVLRKEWRWCFWFVFAQLIIVLLTSLINSVTYYGQFFSQVTAVSEHALRNVSIDSFVYNTMRLFRIYPRGWDKLLIVAARVLLAAAILTIYFRLVHRSIFSTRSNQEIFNSYVILPVLMLAISPSIWSHHFVFLIPTMLIVFCCLREPLEWWLYLAAYVLIFLVPVYDIYPVSYHRLFAILLLVVLFRLLSKHPADGEPEWTVTLKTKLATII